MTRIDFYILPEAGGREQFACRLAEKVYNLGQRLYLHTASAGAAQHLDQLLWTFRDGSFVPHARVGTTPADEEPPPVLIGHQGPPGEAGDPAAGHHDLLINLTDEVPLFFSRFERLAEVVDQDPQRVQAGRERYRFYRERGYELRNHKL